MSRFLAPTAAGFNLDLNGPFAKVIAHGVVAQLGEHLSGRQEVTGSIPVNSTIFLSRDRRNRSSPVKAADDSMTPQAASGGTARSVRRRKTH